MKIYYFLKDFFISKKVFFVDEQFLFENAINEIEAQHLIAIDTEFVWRNTYFPKLSLIQISTGKKIYIFDCFVLNVSKLNKVLSDKNIIKIFHSSRGDLSVINNCLGMKVQNIFDTQLAEDVLNYSDGSQISYKKIVSKYLFKNISKSETNSDWEKRPLREEQIDYAAEDVRYLHQIMKIQNKKLIKKKKLDYFYSLCTREKKLGEEDFLKSRLRRFLKKSRHISDQEIRIFNWREHEAKKLNVPPSHVIEERDIKKLEKIIKENKLDNFRWMIKKNISRERFLNYFS